MPSLHTPVLFRPFALALCAGALLAATGATAVEREALARAEADYRAERSACLAGRTQQDQATCLREAGAALQEARRGQLVDANNNFAANKLRRCENQPPETRDLCVRRMNGEGEVSGSVEGGGIIRELRVIEPVTAAEAAGRSDVIWLVVP